MLGVVPSFQRDRKTRCLDNPFRRRRILSHMAKDKHQLLVVVLVLKAVVYLVMIGFLLIGPFILCLGYMDRKASDKASTWPRATGRIIASKLHTYHRSGLSYRASIQFEYRVGQTRYVSEAVRAGLLYKYVMHPDELASELVRMYPAGRDVSPAYDPESPDRAVLEPGIYTEDRFLRNLGIGFTLASVIAILYNLYDRRRDKTMGVARGDPGEVIWRPGRLAFIKGFYSGVLSPDGRCTASFGTRSVKNSSGLSETVYVCSVE